MLLSNMEMPTRSLPKLPSEYDVKCKCKEQMGSIKKGLHCYNFTILVYLQQQQDVEKKFTTFPDQYIIQLKKQKNDFCPSTWFVFPSQPVAMRWGLSKQNIKGQLSNPLISRNLLSLFLRHTTSANT